jgi:hypothetical protein
MSLLILAPLNLIWKSDVKKKKRFISEDLHEKLEKAHERKNVIGFVIAITIEALSVLAVVIIGIIILAIIVFLIIPISVYLLISWIYGLIRYKYQSPDKFHAEINLIDTPAAFEKFVKRYRHALYTKPKYKSSKNKIITGNKCEFLNAVITKLTAVGKRVYAVGSYGELVEASKQFRKITKACRKNKSTGMSGYQMLISHIK